jgi:hypothetical protein
MTVYPSVTTWPHKSPIECMPLPAPPILGESGVPTPSPLPPLHFSPPLTWDNSHAVMAMPRLFSMVGGPPLLVHVTTGDP